MKKKHAAQPFAPSPPLHRKGVRHAAGSVSHPGRRLKRGFGLLDLTLSLGIGAMAIAGLFQLEADTESGMRAIGLAQTMNQVSLATKGYLSSYSQAILSQTSPGDVVSVPITGSSGPVSGTTSLTSSGVLPASFTASAPLGQKLAVLLMHVAATTQVPEHMEGLVTTYGGNNLNDRQLGLVVNKIGGAGGAMMATPAPEISKASIQGAYGGWSYPAASWRTTTGFQPATGHAMEVVDVVGSPVSEYLDRYNTGNPEANTMHTDINMNNQNLSNTLTVSGVGSQDLYLNNSSHTGRVIMWNGGEACNSNSTGCHFDISDDGGFYDNNNNWVQFQGTNSMGGLRIAGTGNNLDVTGRTFAEGRLYAQAGEDIQGTNTLSFSSFGGSLSMFDNNWLRASGGDGFYGILAPMMAASKFVDSNNSNYYLTPSGDSYLNFVNMQSAWVNGIMNVAGNFYAHADAQIDGNLTVGGRIAANGYSPTEGLPNGMYGGVHAWDLIAEGSLGVGKDSGGNVMTNFAADGTGHVGTTLTIGQKAIIGNANGTAISGNGCSDVGALAQATDGTGALLTCVRGIWTTPGGFLNQKTYSWMTSGTNTSGGTWFINTAAQTDGHDSANRWGSMALVVNGQIVCEQVGTESDHASCAAMVLPGMSWNVYMTAYRFENEWTTITGANLP